MENLPYFPELIRQQALLCAILSSGSVAGIDSSGLNYLIISDKVVEIKNFDLSPDDHFGSLRIVISQSGTTTLEFRTSNAKYKDTPIKYFGSRGVAKIRSVKVNGRDINSITRNFGRFSLLGQFAKISVRSTDEEEYTIYVESTVMLKNSPPEPSFFVEGFPSQKNIIGFFKPEEIKLIPEYTADSNTPTIHIKVEDIDHPILQYYRNGASMLYGGHKFVHNDIPAVNPLRVEKLIFTTTVNEETKERFSELEVVEFPDSVKNDMRISYSTVRDANYYYVEGLMMAKDKISEHGIDLTNYHLQRMVFGKDAFEEFGKREYAAGVAVYTHN